MKQTHSGVGNNIVAHRDINNITNVALDLKLTSESNEVKTIMTLINFLSDSDNRTLIIIDNEVDPDNKINKRFIQYSEYIKNEYEMLFGIYASSLCIAKEAIGLDSVKVELISSYLRDESNKIIMANDGNPMVALSLMVDFFDQKLSQNNVQYDNRAIKFYLLDELIECNVFPNIRNHK